MMNLMQKIFKNRSSFRILTSINTQNLPKLNPSLNHHNPETKINPLPFDSPIEQNVKVSLPLQFYPNFPFGYCLNPVSADGFGQDVVVPAEEIVSDDSGKIWADSVKKKRKRKMNKHKLKKLRKRLRRKT